MMKPLPMPVPVSNSVSSSSSGSSSTGSSSGGSPPLPFARTSPSTLSSDFEIEHSPRKRKRHSLRQQSPEQQGSEQLLRASIAKLVSARARPFSVSGRIPVDSSALILFFRSKSGITHSLDFPIDVEHDIPPAFDVLLGACKPYPSSELAPDSSEALYYPPNLPLTTTLEIANHPILEAIRNTLFPTLPQGHHLTAVRDRLEIVLAGSRMSSPPRITRTDGRVAMILVTLPARFRGGALSVRNAEGNEEKFYGRGGKCGNLEWTAFYSDCDYEMATVQSGCKICITYAVYLKSHGPAGISPDPLITPSDRFLDLMAPILNICRGQRIGIHLTGEYGVNPAEVLADSLVPHLKGSDSLLYHAVKLYKLVPELRWTAGGYIWPVDRTVECVHELDLDLDLESSLAALDQAHLGVPARDVLSATGNVIPLPERDEDVLRSRVEESGAIPLSKADIFVLTDWATTPGPVSREKVPFVSNGLLEKLIMNVLLVVYVP